MNRWWAQMVRSKSIKRTLLKRVACALVMIVVVLSLAACGSSSKSDGPTRADYNEMIKVINVNDDYDLIDVRSALYSFAPAFCNAESYSNLEKAVNAISDYSTDALKSILMQSTYTARAEYKEVKGIYYCSPEHSSDGKGKFLIVMGFKDSDINNYSTGQLSYMQFTMTDDGLLSQLEQW